MRSLIIGTLLLGSLSSIANASYLDKNNEECRITNHSLGASDDSTVELTVEVMQRNKAVDLANRLGAMISYNGVRVENIAIDSDWTVQVGENGSLYESPDKEIKVLRDNSGEILAVELLKLEKQPNRLADAMNLVGIPTSYHASYEYRVQKGCYKDLE